LSKEPDIVPSSVQAIASCCKSRSPTPIRGGPWLAYPFPKACFDVWGLPTKSTLNQIGKGTFAGSPAEDHGESHPQPMGDSSPRLELSWPAGLPPELQHYEKFTWAMGVTKSNGQGSQRPAEALVSFFPSPTALLWEGSKRRHGPGAQENQNSALVSAALFAFKQFFAPPPPPGGKSPPPCPRKIPGFR